MSRKLQSFYDVFQGESRGGAVRALTTGLAGFSPEGNGLPEPKSSPRVRSRRVNIAWVETARVPLKINASPP